MSDRANDTGSNAAKALEQLARSRARMALAMRAGPAASEREDPATRTGQAEQPHAPKAAASMSSPPASAAARWVERPVIGVLIGEARRWLYKQPWQPVASQAAVLTREGLIPVVRRHPLTMALVAAGAGALLTLMVRWAGPSLRNKAVPVVSLAVGLAAREITKPPMRAALLGWLASVGKTVVRRAHAPADGWRGATRPPTPRARSRSAPPPNHHRSAAGAASLRATNSAIE